MIQFVSTTQETVSALDIQPINVIRSGCLVGCCLTFCFLHHIRLMYPIDFSETRKKKKEVKPFALPKLPAYAWAIVAVPAALLCLGVLCMDYLAVRHADTVIDEIEVVALVEGTRQQRKVRKITGFTPEKKTRHDELVETYTFSRVLPFSPRTATVVYTSSGRITKVLRNAEM